MTRSLASIGFIGALAIACGSSRTDGFDQEVANNQPTPEQSSDDQGPSSSGGFGSSGGSGDTNGGDIGTACAATVAQTAKPKVDIIFVIDNSPSMDGEMTQVRNNINSFVGKIGASGLDYQVIFIVNKTKSSQHKICIPQPLAGPDCADNPPVFHHIDQDVQSNNSLKLVLSTYDSSNAKLAWNKHLRADAFKVFVGVSDDGRSDQAFDSFDDQLIAKGGGQFGTKAKRNYVWHSICSWKPGTTPPSAEKCSGADGSSLQYQNLALLTGGIIDSVCKTDYSGVLDNIGKGIVDRLACELVYPTGEAADPTQLQVRITPQGGTPKVLTQVTDESKCAANPDGWFYDDPTNPQKILLCASTCDEANAIEGTKVEALVGCKGAGPK
jgi:hypothetical protein